MKRLPIILLLLVALLAGAKSHWADDARKRKADYMFLESQTQELDGLNDASYELLTRAFQLNPDDKALGYELSMYLIQLSENDPEALSKGIRLLKDYYNANPDDYYASMSYAKISELLGNRDEAYRVWEGLHKLKPEDSQVTYRMAMLLSATGDSAMLRKAASLYDSIMMAEGEDNELFMEKMRLLYALNDTLSIAQQAINKVNAPGGRTVDNLTLAGSVFSALGNDSIALEYFQEACRVDSTSGMAFYSLASFYRQIGDSVGYDREVYQALKRSSLDIEVKETLLKEFYATHADDSVSRKRVSELFEILVDQHPRETSVRELYATFLIYDRDFSQAAEQLEYYVDIDPSSPEKWDLLHNLHMASGEHEKAYTALSKALKYFPQNSNLLFSRGLYNNIEGNISAAVSDIDSAIMFADPKDLDRISTMYAMRGDILCGNDSIEVGLKSYDMALEYNPDNDNTLNNYAYFLATNDGDLDKALSMIERALLINPDNVNSIDTYAWVLFKRKEYAKAREIYETNLDKILEDMGDTCEAYDHAGDIYFMSGDPDEAVEFWKKALLIEPDNELIKKKVAHETYFFK